MSTKICPNCHKKIAEDSVVCLYCSTRFDDTDKPKTDSFDDLFEQHAELFAELGLTQDTSSISSDLMSDDLLEELSPLAEPMSQNDPHETEVYEEVLLTEEDDVDEQDATICLPTSLEEEDDDAVTETKKIRKSSKTSSKGGVWLIVSVVAIIVIILFVLLFILRRPDNTPTATDTTEETAAATTTQTQPTRDAKRDAWLQSFTGQWVDEQSTGKGDIEKQGGYSLYVEEIVEDIVFFDLISCSGPDLNQKASVLGMKAVMEEDTLHFEFEDDGLGNSGEGYIQFHDEGVNVEVMVDEKTAEHSLALNAVFLRQNLPHSDGIDIRVLVDVTSLSALGDEIAEPTTDDKEMTTHYYNGVTAVANKDEVIELFTVDYTALEEDNTVCYECVDGTMTYEVVKEYFGEAEQDYEEIDSGILVLHYPLEADSYLTFTFQAESKLLTNIEFAPNIE